jgi:hypothetical protein
MNLIANRPLPIYGRWTPARPRNAAPQDHDLPILAIEQNAGVKLDWELMIGDGVQPALALGAERRWQGRR